MVRFCVVLLYCSKIWRTAKSDKVTNTWKLGGVDMALVHIFGNPFPFFLISYIKTSVTLLRDAYGKGNTDMHRRVTPVLAKFLKSCVI